MAHVSRWLACEGLGPDDLSPARVEQFFAARRAAGYVNYVTPRALVALFAHLRQLGVAPPDVEPSLSEVEELLASYARGCAPSAGCGGHRAQLRDMVRPFVSSRSDAAGELDLRGLTAGDVLAFVLAECPHRRPGSAKLLVTALRSLLGYLHVEGVIARPLAPVVPSVAVWRLASLPRGLGAEQVTALLASCDSGDRCRCPRLRDHEALGRLGMRRGEVAVWCLMTSIGAPGRSWCSAKAGGASGCHCRSTSATRWRTICAGRGPASAEGRSVFVRVKAPHRALMPAGVSQVVIAAGTVPLLGA